MISLNELGIIFLLVFFFGFAAFLVDSELDRQDQRIVETRAHELALVSAECPVSLEND